MAIGQISSTRTPNLFTFINASAVSYFAALLLCVSFFLQGVNYVEAETLTETETVAVETEDEPEPEAIEEEPEPVLESPVEVQEEEVESEVSSDETASAEEVEDVLNTNEELEETVEADEVEDVIEDDSATTTVDLVEEDEETVEEAGNVETGGGDSGVDPEDIIDSTATTTDEGTSNVEEAVEDDSFTETPENAETASSTELLEEQLPGTTESVSVVQSDTAYTFNREECTKLATGSFYCLKPVEDMLEDALFAAPDEDGDLEIFLVRDGVQSQVTTNQVDDAAPYFDENSNTIVWHRLHNDRFQIVSYEIDSGDETLLTSTRENNMEPTRQGDYTVWQRWVDGSWNIILHNGEDEIKLTNNGGHNVAPYVHGSLVVWNRHNTDGQKTIEMYDIDTQSYVSVPDAEGLSVSNPRMVFVFDSLTPEGDIITKGYDVLSRKFIDLDSLPKNLPDEIPNSDSTGETRALIQSKPTLKTDIEELVESDLDIAVGGPEPELEPLTLNLASSTAEVATSSAAAEDLAEYELVIEPYNGTTTSSSSEQINE